MFYTILFPRLGLGLIIFYFPGAGGIAIVTGALCNTVL